MICVLLLAAGEAWESPALADLEAHPGVVVLKRCVDVDDLLASVTSGQSDVAVVSLDAPGLDPATTAHLRRHAVRLDESLPLAGLHPGPRAGGVTRTAGDAPRSAVPQRAALPRTSTCRNGPLGPCAS